MMLVVFLWAWVSKDEMQRNCILRTDLCMSYCQLSTLKTVLRVGIYILSIVDTFNNIPPKNWEISFLTIKKKQSKVNTSSTSHREFQRRKDKTEFEGPRNENWKRTKHKIKQKSSMNNSASLTPVQGPSTLACMIVTSLSLLPHQLHQLPTVG
jgi:hypothetical protein